MAKLAKFLMIAGLACAVAAPGALHAKSYKHRRHQIPRAAAVQQRQVACTVLGCQPIPAACHPKEEHSPTGIPTGFDQIICPPGVWPF
jgi:hypothetical protein